MTFSTHQSKLSSFLNKAEAKLLLFMFYAISLFITYISKWPTDSRPWPIVTALLGLLIAHSIYMLLFGLIYSRDFIMLYFSPILLILVPIEERSLKRYLNAAKRIKKDVPAETVLILGYPNWHKLSGWLKPCTFTAEVKWLVAQLEGAQRVFSIYPKASGEDVEKLMENPGVKEVIFFGHGESHGFELSSGELLYYCRFNHERYRKSLVHQLHCGTSFGTPLRQFVVPKENWDKCFFIPESIRMSQIKNGFKLRSADLK